MAKNSHPPEPASAAAQRRRHRARVLTSLIEVCGQLQRLKVSREARLACREVAGLLEQARTGRGSRFCHRK